MNKKILIYLIIATCMLLAGCAGGKDARSDAMLPNGAIAEKDLFTLEDITKVFSEQGINLRKANEPIPQQLKLNGKTPAVFQSEYTDEDYYFIWVYDSIEDRSKTLNEYIQNYSDKVLFKGEKIKFSYGLTAKNVLIAYTLKESKKSNPSLDVLNEQNKIEETVLEKLNDIKQIIFEGQGDNWEAKIIVKYFEYYWQDKNGATHKEQYYQKYPVLKYKGNNPEKVGRISYTYDGGSFSGDFLDKDGYVYGSKAAGVESRPKEDDVYTITIKWNDEEETFKMIKVD
ncbi:MAG TPA: hypothetical protein GXX35_04520 [Thermoanaerobacterales bacterium]|nr:hypothetical protein [Thermoanaerobacterales bacterium]